MSIVTPSATPEPERSPLGALIDELASGPLAAAVAEIQTGPLAALIAGLAGES